MTDETAQPPISANLGDYANFRTEMLKLIPRVVVDRGGGALTWPLARLNVNTRTDSTVAMVDAFAALADIISFYQDRVLNEGYLGTAVDYSSLALLGRSIGENPGAYIGATAEIALFAQPGQSVVVPEGASIQANPPKPSGSTTGATSSTAATVAPVVGAALAPSFETTAAVIADPALNQLTPLQTKPVRLDPAADSLLIQGTGLGLAVGDFMLLVSRDKPTQWVRLTVFSVSENHVLVTTTVGIGSSLQSQWTTGGCTVPVPPDANSGLELYALDLTCRLFGYNAPSWSSQSAAVQRANTPVGVPPAEYTEWPGFEINLDDLDLQAVYSKVLPDNQFLLETPEQNTLGAISAVSRQNLSEFGLTGQATHVTLAPDPAVLPTGVALIPSRAGVTASLLGDGRVLLVGGIGEQGVLDSVEVYDPVTGLLSQAARLPSPRGLHTATTINGVVYLAGGVTENWRFATNILQLDPATLTFSAIPGVTLEVVRIGHAATALPDGTLMLSGGLTQGPSGGVASSLEQLLAGSIATKSVVVFAPLQTAWTMKACMQHARAGHTATLCPVVKTSADGGSATDPPVGQIVVFLGGHDGGAMPPRVGVGSPIGTIWNDAEVTDPTTWRPMTGLYALDPDPTKQTRYDHVATLLSGNNGFFVSGGRSATGAVADNWLVGAFARYEPPGSETFLGVPVFVSAPPLLTARSNHAAALLQGGKVVVAGGISGSTVLASVEIFSVSAGTSIPFEGSKVIGPSLAGAPLPQAQADAAFLALPGDELLIAGGLGSLPAGYLNAVVAYDAAIGTFSYFPGPILTTPFTLAPVGSIGLADGTILILGATSPAQFPLAPPSMTAFAWTFDPTTNLSTIAGAPVAARVGATLSLLSNGTVLVAGGMGMVDKDKGYAVLDSAEIYNPKSRSFSSIYQKMTVPRCGHTATVLADGSVLLAGGYSYPAITYDPPGLLLTLVPALDSAETFNAAQQSFAAAATLPYGFAFHSATLLASGNVLIAGGVTEFYTERNSTSLTFTSATASPSGNAAIFDVAAQAFAVISPLGTPRAMHSATLLTSGKVLIAGGGVTPDLTATGTTELFDPDNYTFAKSYSLAVPRRSQGAILVPEGLLMIGGASTPSYEIIPANGNGGETAYPLPFPLPSPPYPFFVSLAARVTPIPIGGIGVYVFGGQIDSSGANTCEALLYVMAPPSPDSSARRQALVYTQSRQLYLAPPINDQPLKGYNLELTGLITDIAAGRTLLMAGNPPLAKTVGVVTGLGGSPELDAGTIVMALAPVMASSISEIWWANVPDRGVLSIEAHPNDKPPSGLAFLSGNGTTIGNVTAQQLALFTRPVSSEAITVKSVQLCRKTNTTLISLDQPLRYLYDRTTTTVYGNVVEARQGIAVNEVLGSGNGKKPFLQFMLKQAPLNSIEESDGSIVPDLEVKVNDLAWSCVEALSDCGPDERAYQLTQDAQGRALVQFGDGVNGLRPPTGQNNIAASYRIGAGTSGNVPAGSLSRPPTNIAGIKGVLNPVAASGGIGATRRGALRGQIPIGVADIGRIVTQADMLTFVLNRPEVGAATLSDAADTDPVTSLVTLTGLGNAVLDRGSIAFKAVEAAFDAALADGKALANKLLDFEPVPFKVTGTFTLKKAMQSADTQKVESEIDATLRAAYDISVMSFDQAVRSTEIIALIVKKVPAVESAVVIELWVPSEQTAPERSASIALPLPFPSPLIQQVLYPNKANYVPPGPAIGAQILCISTDADAVSFDLSRSEATPARGGSAEKAS